MFVSKTSKLAFLFEDVLCFSYDISNQYITIRTFSGKENFNMTKETWNKFVEEASNNSIFREEFLLTEYALLKIKEIKFIAYLSNYYVSVLFTQNINTSFYFLETSSDKLFSKWEAYHSKLLKQKEEKEKQDQELHEAMLYAPNGPMALKAQEDFNQLVKPY
jgi:hypothetical protein